MSLLDEIHKFEQQVVERLKQLEPLIGEYNQLRRLAQRLGVSYTASEQDTAPTGAPARKSAAKKSGSAAKPGSARRTPAKRATRTRAAGAKAGQSAGAPATAAKAAPATATAAKRRAPRGRGRKAATARPGRRADDVLRVVGEHPGITVREIGERLGVDATGLYRVANKLTADGRLRKDGTRLYVVESDAAAQPNGAAESNPTATNGGAEATSLSGSDGTADATPGDDATSSS